MTTEHFDPVQFRAKVKELSRNAHGFQPIYFDIGAAKALDKSVDAEHRRIGTSTRPNRQLTMLADVTAFLKAVFPSGVTPTGTRITPEVIAYAMKNCFIYYC